MYSSLLDSLVKAVFGALAFIEKGIEYKSWEIVLLYIGETTFGVACEVTVAHLLEGCH